MKKILQTLLCTVGTAATVSIASPSDVFAFTIGQYASDDFAINLQGQSFTPNQIGPNGTGIAPASGPVFLNSFTLSYPNVPSASTLYIYSALPAIVDGTTALSTSTSFTDSLIPALGSFNRTFFFPDVQLESSQKYFALLPQNENLNYLFSPDTYSGGAFVFATLNETMSNNDLAFSASLVPFEFSPVVGLMLLGTVFAVRQLKRVRL